MPLWPTWEELWAAADTPGQRFALLFLRAQPAMPAGQPILTVDMPDVVLRDGDSLAVTTTVTI